MIDINFLLSNQSVPELVVPIFLSYDSGIMLLPFPWSFFPLEPQCCLHSVGGREREWSSTYLLEAFGSFVYIPLMGIYCILR